MIQYLPLKDIAAKYQPALQEKIAEVVTKGIYLLGEETAKFEQEYAAYIGTKHCIACGNGYDALWLILKAYKEMGILKDGDGVIVPANTFIASALAITNNGLDPIFADPEYNTSVMSIESIKKAYTPQCKAVMLVHLYGRNSYSQDIADFCRQYGLKIIEDNAQAHGCIFSNCHTGSLGDAAAHSFYPGKNLGAMGDAGAITTNDSALHNAIMTLHNYGSSQKYIHTSIGVNSRMDEIQAAVLRIKLRNLDEENNHRKHIAQTYLQNINNCNITLQPTTDFNTNVFHIFPIFSKHREKLISHLADKGISTLIHYPIPVHKQKCYKEYNSIEMPIAERLASEELSLPCHPVMSVEDAEKVIEAVNNFHI